MKIDSFSSVDIAISGMQAHQKSMEVISSNVANARTSDTGKGQPYRRLEVMFKPNSDEDITGVEIKKLAPDMSDFQQVVMPGHPQADENGYVLMPNVKLPVEMMNLTIATRAYEANVAVLKRYQSMVENTLELLR